MPSLPRLKNSDNFSQWATKINDALVQFESFQSTSLDPVAPVSGEFAIYDGSFVNKGLSTYYSTEDAYRNLGDLTVTIPNDNYTIKEVLVSDGGSGYSTPTLTPDDPLTADAWSGGTSYNQDDLVSSTAGANSRKRFYKATTNISSGGSEPTHTDGIVSNWLFVARTAVLDAVVETGGITSVTVTDGGYGYTSTPPDITITGSGSGASLSARMHSNLIATLTPNSIFNKDQIISLTDTIRSNDFLLVYDSVSNTLKKIQISIITPNVPTGAVLFGSPTDSYTWDSSNFYWDDSNNRLGIGTSSPSYSLHVVGDANLSSTYEYRIAGNSVLSATALGSGVVSSSLTSVGTIGTGVWQGTAVAGQYGGTGTNNAGKFITLGGNLTTSGAYNLTLTLSGTTNATLPSGTTTLVPTDGTGATGTWSIAISGNAATATKLSSSKTISLTGSVTGSTSTDFTGNVSINTSLANQNSDALPSTIVVRDGSGSFNVNVLGATGVALNTGASTSVRLEGISGATGIIRFPTSNSGTVVTTTDSGTVTSTMIADGTIVDGDISGSAAIAKSKLALTNAIVNADINTSAAIAVSKLAASTISGIVLGNNLNSLTLATSGVGLSGSGSYNGSGAVTFTVTSDATNTNTPSTLVSRDASGNFAGGTITAATTFSGPGTSLTNLPAGQLTGTIPSGVLGNSSLFVGTTSIALNRSSANLALTGITSINAISIPASSGNFVATGDTGTVTNNMLAGSIAYNKLSLVGTIVNADISASASIAISKLAFSTISGVSLGNNLNTLTLNTTGTGISGSGSYNGSGAVTFTVTANSVALSATPNSLVLRDGNGDFTGRHINSTYFASTDDVSAGTISYIVAKFGVGDNYYRSATAAKVATFISGQTMNISGNATTVTNGVYTTGSYADPSWITSLAGSKITGNISGNAANITAYTINQSVGTGNSPSFAGLTVTGLISSGPQANKTIIIDYVPTSVTGSVSVGYGYTVNATGITLTLPNSGLADGDRISFIPGSNLINSYTISGNGNAIMNTDTSLTVDSAVPFDLIWNGTNSRWVLG